MYDSHSFLSAARKWALEKVNDFPSRACHPKAAKGNSSLCPASARTTFTNGFVFSNSVSVSVSSRPNQYLSLALPLFMPVVAEGREPFTNIFDLYLL